ncbi:gas vesicle protein GvpO, halophile-type [Natronorarus salvus]|uniref:gas vesicle protein GvpO, halophile-type n=1 Tax=Natronorarus salvus TaxID=3117733 RepID=UPI002F26A735
MAETADQSQCRALTGSGDRCTREAIDDDGFCYQHGPDDETVEGESDDGETTEHDDGGDQHVSEDSNDCDVGESDLGRVRNKVGAVAEKLIGRPLVSVVSVERVGDEEEENWLAAVEVIERSAIPDTQDIIGRYEITLDDPETITGYRRTHRYRRGDMEQDI